MNVDDGLDDIRWIRCLEGEGLPAVSNPLLPNLKNGVFVCHGRGMDIFLSSFFYTHLRPHVFFVRRLAGARHISPAIVWTL